MVSAARLVTLGQQSWLATGSSARRGTCTRGTQMGLSPMFASFLLTRDRRPAGRNLFATQGSTASCRKAGTRHTIWPHSSKASSVSPYPARLCLHHLND